MNEPDSAQYPTLFIQMVLPQHNAASVQRVPLTGGDDDAP
jgi:hypothetical protein